MYCNVVHAGFQVNSLRQGKFIEVVHWWLYKMVIQNNSASIRKECQNTNIARSDVNASVVMTITNAIMLRSDSREIYSIIQMGGVVLVCYMNNTK